MRTTININDDLLKKIKDVSFALNISVHDCIALLLHEVTDRKFLDTEMFNGTRYQDADPGKQWSKFHVTFEPQVYEKGLDCRRFFKVSVSLLISLAAVYFLDEIIKKFQKIKRGYIKVDNYQLNYIFIANMYNNIRGFTVFWGYPEERYLKTLL